MIGRIIQFLHLAALVSLVVSWPSRRSYYDRDLVDALRISRRNHCLMSAGKCFSTTQCCSGLVCAALDDYFGLKPEVPGSCVTEKDLRMCTSSSDCPGSGRCMAIGRSSERYCIPEGVNQLPTPLKSALISSDYSKMSGGLGAACQDDSDCNPFTQDGSGKLCCQAVRRGRQGTKKLCDRITAISECITAA